jgi:hypothetical protein
MLKLSPKKNSNIFLWKKIRIFQNIWECSILEMEFSKLINYLVDMCWSYSSITILGCVSHQWKLVNLKIDNLIFLIIWKLGQVLLLLLFFNISRTIKLVLLNAYKNQLGRSYVKRWELLSIGLYDKICY